MLIYNVTIQVNKEIATEWLEWLKNEHIADMMRSGCFVNHQVVRLLHVDESESITYAVQYYAEDQTQLDRYLNEHAATLRQKGTERWGDRFIAFRTIMEVVK
jgi:Domain of unknown function (DUF4286)